MRADGDGVTPNIYSDRVVENPSDKQSSLLRNYCEHVHNKFNKYAACFFFCELLNVTISVSQVSLPGVRIIRTNLNNIACQIFVTHAFLNYNFLDFGYNVYKFYR